MVTVGETITLVPLPTAVPPQEPLYHCQLVASFNVPEEMLNVVLLPVQIVEAVAESDGIVGSVQKVPAIKYGNDFDGL